MCAVKLGDTYGFFWETPKPGPHPCNHFPGGSAVKNPTCQYRRCAFDPWVGKIPWRRKWQPASVFLPGEFHGAWQAPWGRKESDSTEATWHALQVAPAIAGRKQNKAKCNQAGPQGRKQAGGKTNKNIIKHSFIK